ncbi:MAG: energy transducer TonB [Verrucomicrobiota bacterium]
MSPNDYGNYDDERTFMQRYGFAVGVGAVVLLGIIIFAGRQMFSGHSAPPHKNQEISMVRLLPPPPPPPPLQKPPEPMKMKQEMVTQEHVDKDEQKPDEQPKAAPVTTGNGSKSGLDMGLLSGNGGNGMLGGNGHHSGKWGWYAAQVQTQIEDALRANSKTRAAKLRIVVKIWPDPNTGRVTRAELSGSLGDPALENAIKNEIMTGLQLREPPPRDMPLPIILRLTEQRPG